MEQLLSFYLFSFPVVQYGPSCPWLSLFFLSQKFIFILMCFIATGKKDAKASKAEIINS